MPLLLKLAVVTTGVICGDMIKVNKYIYPVGGIECYSILPMGLCVK